MRLLVLRLLALVAVLLMPFGMSAAPAASMPHQMSAMSMQHCPQPASGPASKGVLGDCTMACSAALPAAYIGLAVLHPFSPLLPPPSLFRPLPGIELEIATPPPRLT
jgi:hypothetical protein